MSYHSILLAIFLCSGLYADTVKMKSGTELECIVIQENSDSIVVRRGYGTMQIPRSAIATISKAPVISGDIAPATQPTPGQRVPAWSSIVGVLANQKWATGLQQIPATVVDVGAMKSVPYQSYHCGTDYEVNIYGDPDHPAAIEIGIYRSLLTNATAKQNCVEFIASVLGDKVDSAIVRVMDRSKDLVTRNDVIIEITPPTAPDAYGGWWVSVYSEKQLELARATEAELQQIAVAKAPNPVATPPVARISSGGTISSPPPSRTETVRPVDQSAAAADMSSSDDGMFGGWTSADLSKARSTSSASSSGRVYVKGYFRKDGTYVQPHTRRR